MHSKLSCHKYRVPCYTSLVYDPIALANGGFQCVIIKLLLPRLNFQHFSKTTNLQHNTMLFFTDSIKMCPTKIKQSTVCIYMYLYFMHI